MSEKVANNNQIWRDDDGQIHIQRVEELLHPPKNDISEFLKMALSRLPPVEKFNPQKSSYHSENVAIELLEQLKEVLNEVIFHQIVFSDEDILRAKGEIPNLKTYYVWNTYEFLGNVLRYLNREFTTTVSQQLMENESYFYHSLLMLQKKLIWMQNQSTVF